MPDATPPPHLTQEQRHAWALQMGVAFVNPNRANRRKAARRKAAADRRATRQNGTPQQ